MSISSTRSSMRSVSMVGDIHPSGRLPEADESPGASHSGSFGDSRDSFTLAATFAASSSADAEFRA
eukprot:2179956-Amphidinium_carterae.1